MDNEKIIAVLTELLEEQKEMRGSQTEISAILEQIVLKLESVESNLQKHSNNASTVDTRSIQQVVEKGISGIKNSLEFLSKKDRSSNLRIFLESDAKKWAVYLIIALTFLTYLYNFGVHK